MVRPVSIACVIALFTLLGCAPKRTYQVELINKLNEPVTIWLTKSGPPVEGPWRAPEHLAMERPGEEDPLGGVVVPPGKTAFTGKVSGEFPDGTDAILRVYLGERTMSELLAMSRRSPDRFDILLQPGKNELTVNDRGGDVVITRADGADVPPLR